MDSLALTKSLEDYLEMIHMLQKEGGKVRVKDMSTALSVKMPSVVKAITLLKEQDLVIQEPYGDIELTPVGEKMAKKILARHLLLREFLINLGVSTKIANEDACLMEHILSPETLDRIEEFNQNVKINLK